MVKLKVVKSDEPTQEAPQTEIPDTATPPWEPEAVESASEPATTDSPEQQAETMPTAPQSNSSDSEPVTEQQPAIYEEIADALAKINAAECDIIRAKSQVKAAQTRLDEAQEKLREVSYRLIDHNGVPQHQAPTQNQQEATAISGETASDAWKSVPLTALNLDKVEGLGNKKREALLDAIPNMGAFEKARTEAGASHFSTQLPKGFGEKIADQLVELFINWTVENKHLFQQSLSEPTATADTIPPPFSSLTDAEQIAYLENRFAEIESNQSWECQGNQDAYNNGRSDADNIDNYTDCIYTDYDAIDDYLRGYLSARGEALVESREDNSSSIDDIDNI